MGVNVRTLTFGHVIVNSTDNDFVFRNSLVKPL